MNGLKNVRNRRDDALARVGWDRLEVMLADYYRTQGWSVDHVGTGGRRSRFDGGIDLKLRRGGEYVLVQSKHWNAKQVTHNAVHELLGIKINENATGAIVVTSGEFTRAAEEAAIRQGHVQLIDGDALRIMLGPQLDSLAIVNPPPLPGSSIRPRKDPPPSGRKPIAALLVLVLFVPLVCYGAYRLLTAPLFSHRIDIQLPQRVIGRPASPDTRRAVQSSSAPRGNTAEVPTIEQEMSEEELKEWKRRNEESMKILEQTTPEL